MGNQSIYTTAKQGKPSQPNSWALLEVLCFHHTDPSENVLLLHVETLLGQLKQIKNSCQELWPG